MNVNYVDNADTDGDFPYPLFPVSNATNGGYTRPGGGTDANKYVVDTGAYNSEGTGFFQRLKAATLVLNKTDAIIAGTEMGGFDTHSNQGTTAGSHPNLLRRIGWAFYALRKYLLQNGDRATWDNLVVVTLSEFGRATIENSDSGTDHAEASVMFVGGGGIRGWDGLGRSGVRGCHTGDAVPWIPGPANQSGGVDGSLFGVGNAATLQTAVFFLMLFGLGWGFFDCNNMPILCQIVRPELRATGYGVMNLVSISCGGFADWGFGALRDRGVPLNMIFGVFAGVALLSVLIVLMIRPREIAERK